MIEWIINSLWGFITSCECTCYLLQGSGKASQTGASKQKTWNVLFWEKTTTNKQKIALLCQKQCEFILLDVFQHIYLFYNKCLPRREEHNSFASWMHAWAPVWAVHSSSTRVCSNYTVNSGPPTEDIDDVSVCLASIILSICQKAPSWHNISHAAAKVGLHLVCGVNWKWWMSHMHFRCVSGLFSCTLVSKVWLLVLTT